MRRLFVLFAIAIACLFSALGLALTSARGQSHTQIGAPNFVCVATWNFGICIGPPTKRA